MSSNNLNDTQGEEPEFQEFIDQINALQQMQDKEQQELNIQRRSNVELMEEFLKAKRRFFNTISQYTTLNLRHAELQKENQGHQHTLNKLVLETEELLAKEMDLTRSLDAQKKKQEEEARFYRTHVKRLENMTRIREQFIASLDCSRRLKELQQQLSSTNDKIAHLSEEEMALDQVLTTFNRPLDEDTMHKQHDELLTSISRINERSCQAEKELAFIQAREAEQATMMNEDFGSTLTEMMHYDHETQLLESLLEKERMEAESLKVELAALEKRSC